MKTFTTTVFALALAAAATTSAFAAENTSGRGDREVQSQFNTTDSYAVGNGAVIVSRGDTYARRPIGQATIDDQLGRDRSNDASAPSGR